MTSHLDFFYSADETPKTFKTKDDVITFLKGRGLESGEENEVFRGNELIEDNSDRYAPNYYTPKKYDDGWGVHVQRNYYANTINYKADGRSDMSEFYYNPFE